MPPSGKRSWLAFLSEGLGFGSELAPEFCCRFNSVSLCLLQLQCSLIPCLPGNNGQTPCSWLYRKQKLHHSVAPTSLNSWLIANIALICSNSYLVEHNRYVQDGMKFNWNLIWHQKSKTSTAVSLTHGIYMFTDTTEYQQTKKNEFTCTHFL